MANGLPIGCLLVGPVRRWLGATIGRAIERRRPRPRTGPGSVIDLRADEWRPVPDPEPRKRD